MLALGAAAGAAARRAVRPLVLRGNHIPAGAAGAAHARPPGALVAERLLGAQRLHFSGGAEASAGSSAAPAAAPAAAAGGPLAPATAGDKPTIFDAPRVVRPGQTVDVATVVRNWWSFPAVGFNSILEMPVHKLEALPPDDPPPVGTVVVPNSIFGLPIRKDIIHKVYWYHRRQLAGYCETMQMYKWEWPGSNKKHRTQKKAGKARMGRRKAPGRFDGVYATALRPKDWAQGRKINKRVVWLAVRYMLSVKFAQDAVKVVDSFNLQSHKTKHLVRHLRRILGRSCRSALLVHEGNFDINDNCRWASAHIPSVKRENVEGINVYNLLKCHQLVITEAALAKLINEVQRYPRKRGWGQKFATPDGKAAPVPEKVPGWNKAWVERKERLMNAEFRAKEFFLESQKWKWSPELRGPLKVPRNDPLAGFRVKDFLVNPEKPAWEKLESLYVDDEPLDEAPEDDEFEDLMATMEGFSKAGEARRTELIEDPAEIQQQGLRALSAAASARSGPVSRRAGGRRGFPRMTGAPRHADEEEELEEDQA